jgi:hypothetical protein
METLDQLLKVIGGIVLAGGGLSLIVYQAFKHLAAKWLDARFEERLQALKHQHGKEIEELRFKISTMLDRATKLHQREFEVLPEAWSKLNDAFWNVRGFVSPMQSYPDIDRMSNAQQIEFIRACRLNDWQKTELLSAKDKNDVYQHHIFWHKLSDAQEKSRDAYSYLIKNGIFINDEIRGGFSAIHDLVWNALTEHQLNEEHKIRPRQRDAIGRLLSDGEAAMKDLERMVHQRLWPENSALRAALE